MHESNQGPTEGFPPPGDPGTAVSWAPEPYDQVLRGLRIWFAIFAVVGLAGVLLGQAELVIMVALAGVFVAAQAADRNPGFETLHFVLSGLFVVGGVFAFGSLTVGLWNEAPASAIKPVAIGLAAGGAILCVVTWRRGYADGLSEAFFRTSETGHTLRLAARVTLMILLFAIPGWVAAPALLDQLEDLHQPLLDSGQMVSTVVGLTLLAFAAVGFLVRRDLRGTLARLGLERLRPPHAGVVALGVAVLYFLNLGAEALQRLWFPAQWAHDQRINQMIAGGLDVRSALLLGLTAGIGEELAMRGALQPRLGVFLTSAAFASLHVHYSWFGMGMIFVLGVALGTIRRRTSTTVAILVHGLYDIAAVFAAGPPGR